MKKILVVLLVLAVASGVFAQSSNWSMAATVEIGTRIDFDPRVGDTAPSANPAKLEKWGENNDTQVALANGLGFNWWDKPRMKAVLTYAGTGYVAEFQMNTRADNEFFIQFARPTYKAKCGIWGFEEIFWTSKDSNPESAWPFSVSWGETVKRLWGEYYLLDGMVQLDIAYKSEELQFWFSDLTGAFYHNWSAAALWMDTPEHYRGWYYKNHGFFDDRNSFAHQEEKNYFRVNLGFSGVDLGLLVPNLFGAGLRRSNGVYAREGYDSGNPNEFVNGSLKKSIFGAKINLYPIEFAAQFKFEDYGVYFGGKFFVGPVTIGASFMGIMNPADGSQADKRIRVGGNVAYDAGQMGAGVKASLDRNNGKTGVAKQDGYSQLISVQPYFFFKIIPSHLGFKLDTGFYFRKFVTGDTETNDMYWAVQPQLFWNFRGTGAATGYPWGSAAGASTGMFVRYRMVSNLASFLDVVFSVSM